MWTKQTVRGTLDRLQAIAPSLHQSAPGDEADSNRGPEFRYLVRQLVAYARPQCRVTTTAENEQIMGPAQAEIARFRRGLDGTAFADQFDVAQADAAYQLSIEMVECADPSRTDAKRLGDDAAADVRRQLAAIGALIKSSPDPMSAFGQ